LSDTADVLQDIFERRNPTEQEVQETLKDYISRDAGVLLKLPDWFIHEAQGRSLASMTANGIIIPGGTQAIMMSPLPFPIQEDEALSRSDELIKLLEAGAPIYTPFSGQDALANVFFLLGALAYKHGWTWRPEAVEDGIPLKEDS